MTLVQILRSELMMCPCLYRRYCDLDWRRSFCFSRRDWKQITGEEMSVSDRHLDQNICLNPDLQTCPVPSEPVDVAPSNSD